MNDIAAHAGVSQATVSYVLNDKLEGRRVGESTRERVLEAAAQLGYRRNEIARAMVTGRSRVLGFLVHAPSLQTSSRILEGALDEANERNYFIKIVRWDRQNLQPAIERCLEMRLDGVFAFSLTRDEMDLLQRETKSYGLNIGTVYNTPCADGCIQVRTDEHQSLQLAVEHLAKLGHRRIAMLSTRPEDALSNWRLEAFECAMKNCGLETADELLGFDNWEHDIADAEVRKLMSTRHAPTAIICHRDSTALTCMRTLRRLGLRVPDDVSVVGQGNFTMAEVADPPLTSLALPLYQTGRRVVRMLIERAEGGETEKEVLLPSELAVRESTAIAKQA